VLSLTLGGGLEGALNLQTMKAFEQLERLKRMNKLIRVERTGTPSVFARFLGISERQLYKLIEEIEAMGLQVKYSRNRNTFFYESDEVLEIDFSFKLISANKLRIIYGGSGKNTSLLFLCREAM